MSSVQTGPRNHTRVPARGCGAAPRKGGKRRRPRRLPLLLALLLFGGGLLLGRVQAAKTAGAAGSPAPSGGGAGEGAVSAVPPAIPDTGGGSQGGTAEDWDLILVNGENPLSEDFSVPELTELRNGQRIDSRAYPALQKMMDAARAAGYEPLICSSYRSRDKQAELFQRKVQSYLEQGYPSAEAERQASFWVARPGTSEHQTGLAADIVDQSYQLLDEEQENTPVQRWLMAHCAEYGFILRYPTGKSDITGIGYEPWHYRYVGLDAAGEIMEQGLCLEEYLALAPAR